MRAKASQSGGAAHAFCARLCSTRGWSRAMQHRGYATPASALAAQGLAGSHGIGTGCAAPSADCSFSSQRILCSSPMTCTARTKECHHNKGRCSGPPPLAKVLGNGRSKRSPFCLHAAVHHLTPASLSASSHDVGMLHPGVDLSCATRSDATTGCAALLVLPCCNRRARSRIDERKMRNMIYEPKAASHSPKTPPLHL